jgi:ubiquinone/menaquinone biosynthesis C-methylase UbiE
MRRALHPFAAALLLAPTLARGQSVHSREQAEHLHRDPQAYIAMLENPARDAYQKPEEVLKALALREGETVADIGAGSGYFTLRFARAVGESGRVWAVDVDPAMILHLNRRVHETGLWQIRSLLAPPDDPLLADASVDRFFICDTWHHIDAQERYLALMKKMLRPGGQVVMIDFQKRELPVGPPLAMKIAREALVEQMQRAGFRLLREHGFLPYQYFLVFGLE